MESRVRWTSKRRPRKADNGHSIVRTGELRDRATEAWVTKTYAECQCGKVSQGQGRDGGFNSHRKHQKRVGAK